MTSASGALMSREPREGARLQAPGYREKACVLGSGGGNDGKGVQENISSGCKCPVSRLWWWLQDCVHLSEHIERSV